MQLDTLISAPELAASLDDPELRIVDCRFDLADEQAGARAYGQSHIRGAVYGHLHKDLAAPVTAQTGRHPLPDPERFAATLGSWGIGNDSQVVVYDGGPGAMAARLWWMLRWLGHAKVAVLDGGFAAWQLHGGSTSSGISRNPKAVFRVSEQSGITLDAEQVEQGLAARELLLIDVRARPRYLGETEPLDTVAGHIPGAINLPFEKNLDAQGRFLPGDALAKQYGELLAANPGKQPCFMCGSGVTACHGLLAMEVAGIHGALLYPGSWSEWITDSDRAVAVGDSPD
jgi:thiosulfate/3-mercaptopyruvate sulfurtransferase